MKIASAVGIISLFTLLNACDNAQEAIGTLDNAKYHSSKNIVNPSLVNENLGFTFSGYDFDIETYLSPSFLARNTISGMNIIALNDDHIERFSSERTPFDTLNADFLFTLSLNDEGRIINFLSEGLGEYQTDEYLTQLNYTKGNQLQSIEESMSYGDSRSEYFYNGKNEIESKRSYHDEELIEFIDYVVDSIGVTYQINNTVDGQYTALKIIKYDGVISEEEAFMALDKLTEAIKTKKGPFASIKEANSWIEIISYKDGLKMREESWNLETNTRREYTDYIYWNSKVLIKAIGKHDIWGDLYTHSKKFLYTKNGDLKTIFAVYEQPETLDSGTRSSKYEFEYDQKGMLLDLVEHQKSMKWDWEIERVVQFQYY